MMSIIDLDYGTMPKRCGDCAFTKGTDAQEKSGVLAELCVEAVTMFFCHQRAGSELVPREIDGDQMVCRGYVEALSVRGERPPWAVAVARECIRIWDESAGKREVPIEEIAARVLAAGAASGDV